MHRFTSRRKLLARIACRIGARCLCRSLPIAASAATTLRFGHANNNGEIATDLFQEFADNVTKRTKGEVTIRCSRPSSSARKAT